MLSDFSGAAENPLSEGGNWIQTSPDRPPLLKDSPNSVTNSVFGDPNYSTWVREVFYGNAEVWACISGGQLGAALETWRVALFTQIGINVQGYLLYYGGGLSKDLVLRKYTGGFASFTAIGSVSPPYPSSIGIRINGGNVEAWWEGGGGWTLGFTVADNAYRGGFYATLGIEDPTGGGLNFSCFGGGAANRSQFFRWLYN